MSHYPENDYKIMIAVYAGVISVFSVYVLVGYATQKHSQFIQGECIKAKDSERWEQPKIYRVLEVGNKKYRLRSKTEDPNKFSIYCTGENAVVTFEESYPDITTIDQMMEGVECPEELK